MTHLARVWPVVYYGQILSGADLLNIDIKTVAAINGDGGGTYNPVANLFIAGLGVGVLNEWTVTNSARYEGGLIPAPGITFGEKSLTDAFLYETGHVDATRTRNRVFDEPFTPNPTDIAIITQFVIDLANVYRGVARMNKPGTRFYAEILPHNRSQFNYVLIWFYVGVPHAEVPKQMPRFRIVRVDSEGNVEPLHGPDAFTDSFGFQPFQTPAGGITWYNSGNVQSHLYSCTQNGVVDMANYVYLVEIIEEDGSNSWTDPGDGNIYVGTQISYGLIPTMNHQQ